MTLTYLACGKGKRGINQEHSKHHDACLFHQHHPGPQKQTEQQEEERNPWRKIFLNTALIQPPEKQVRDPFNLRRIDCHGKSEKGNNFECRVREGCTEEPVHE